MKQSVQITPRQRPCQITARHCAVCVWRKWCENDSTNLLPKTALEMYIQMYFIPSFRLHLIPLKCFVIFTMAHTMISCVERKREWEHCTSSAPDVETLAQRACKSEIKSYCFSTRLTGVVLSVLILRLQCYIIMSIFYTYISFLCVW